MIMEKSPIRILVDSHTDKMKLTNNAKFMHCLPVRRNVIVTDEVIDSENSIVIEQIIIEPIQHNWFYKKLEHGK